MTDRVALVTGAGRGIGAATAVRLADAGWRLVLVDRAADDTDLTYPLATREELDAVAERCGGAAVVVGDVREPEVLASAVATAEAEHGGLDAAIAAAGAVRGGLDVASCPDAVWETMIGVNLTGVFHTVRAAIPALRRRPAPRHGRIVAIASAGGTVGLPRLAAYSAAKHGVIGLVRSAAAELGTDGITVNAIAPGSTDTPILEPSAAAYDLDDPGAFAAHHRIGRLLDADEVAASVAWLCSVDASAVTGAVLAVDGGMTA